MTTLDVRKPPMTSDEFLSIFFGAGNRITLPAIRRRDVACEWLNPWVARLEGAEPAATVLPVQRPTGRTDWYALAFGRRQLVHLGEELSAFTGPSWTTFRAQRAELDENDPIEAAIRDFTGDHAFKFQVAVDESGFRRALEQMRAIWTERPIRLYEPPRPVGRVLRDFYLALSVGEREVAERELAYLRDHHHQDERNLLFLRVRMLDAFRRADAILALEELPTLLLARRPAYVSQALLRAVYRHELQRFEDEGDPGGAIQRFQRIVRPRYGELWAFRGGDHSPEVIKAFMLDAVSGPEPNPVLRDELLAIEGLTVDDRAYLASLAASADAVAVAVPRVEEPVIAPPGGIDEAEAAARDGDFDRAFALASGLPPSKRQTRLLGECAYELQTLQVQRAFLDALAAVSEPDREALLGLRQVKAVYDELTMCEDENSPTEGGPPAPLIEVPTDWEDWFQLLVTEPPAARALAFADQGATEWSPEALATNPERIARLVAHLQETRTVAAEQILRDALPHLLRFFQRDSAWPRDQFREVYNLLRLLLVVSSRGNDTELVLLDALIAASLGLGTTRKDYSDLVAETIEYWGSVASPAKIPFALEWLDTLLYYPCPAHDVRTELLVRIADVFQRQGRLLGVDQWLAFRDIVRDYGIEDTYRALFETQQGEIEKAITSEQAIFERLGSRTVLLYCGNETKVRRAEALIKEYYPGASITTCSSGAGSAWLRQKAKDVDIVVLDWTIASHAASDCITHNRPSNRPTLFPRRGSFATIVEALRNYLEAPAAVA